MRILSYNIQAAINARSYLSYTWQWHRQILPGPAKRKTLARIAAYISQFDLVCLQEIDLGGLRNGFLNHVEQLRDLSGLPYALAQTNRRLGKLSLHGNLILSKTPLREVLNQPLPSRIPGRGVLAAAVESTHGALVVAIYTTLAYNTALPWYANPLLILLGTLLYGGCTLLTQILLPHRQVQEDMAAAYAALADYIDAKACYFDPDDDDYAPRQTRLALANTALIQALNRRRRAC